jgi:hypothetical protein
MRYLFFALLGLIGVCGHAQSTNIRISGKVYYETSTSQMQKAPTKGVIKKSYPSDFKVILFKAGSLAMDQQYAKDNKKKICSNDATFRERFSPQIVYTDRNGSYEFKDLTMNADYILIFCDTQIQISVVNTKNKRNITYTMKDKKVTL